MSEADFYWDVNLYCKKTSETKALWDSCIGRLSGKTLFVTGIGFDPRAVKSIEILFDKKAPPEQFHCLGIKSAADAVGANSAQKEQSNIRKLKKLFPERLRIEHSIGSEKQTTSLALCILLKRLNKEHFFDEFDQIVIDVGAMPRVTFLTLVPKLLEQFIGDKGELNKKNMFVIALENAQFDSSITEHVTDANATFLHQYSLNSPSLSPDLPGVWFPIMGASRKDELETIKRDIQKVLRQDGVEVVPILPFPSIDPKLSDKIIGDFYHVLFEEFEVNYSNILYAAENDPFHLYRRLMKSFMKYAKNFTLLGGGRFVVSPLSGKLMSVGAILAVFEASRELSDERLPFTPLISAYDTQNKYYFGVPLVEPTQYKVQDNKVNFEHAELSLLWLLGDAYDE